jgi:hypothetical protein
MLITGAILFTCSAHELPHKEWTAIPAWSAYRAYRCELNEETKTLKLWVRRKPVHRGFEYSGACTMCKMCAGDPGPFVVWEGSKEGNAGRVFQDRVEEPHLIQLANDAVDEARRAEFFRKWPEMRDLIKGKKWLSLSRRKNLEPKQRGVLNRLLRLNRRVSKYAQGKFGEWDYR